MSFFERTKTNRLKKPKHIKTVREFDKMISSSGQPLAKVGDYVFQHFLGISAGTVDKVIAIREELFKLQPSENYVLRTPVEVEFLDGERKLIWMWHLNVIDYSAIQEVKDFYLNEGRPERIKVTW